jgi:hypothetical protein
MAIPKQAAPVGRQNVLKSDNLDQTKGKLLLPEPVTYSSGK